MKVVHCNAYGPPEVLQLKEVEVPTPKPNEILIRIRATSVTVADFRIRSFTVPPIFWIPGRLVLGITKPRQQVLGVEFSGEVQQVGSKVTRFNIGDEVFVVSLLNRGGYAEFTVVPEDAVIAKKPYNLTHEQTATIPVGAYTALQFLKRANIATGKHVLIYGASGSVGTYAIQLAKHFGATVTAVCSNTNAALVKSLGADFVADYNDATSMKNLGKYDIVFLAIDKLPFAEAKRLLKDDGVYVNITAPVMTPSMMWNQITTKQKIVMASTPPITSDILAELKDLAEANVLKPVVDKVYRLDQIVEAHRYVETGRKKGNVAITVR